MRHRYTVIGFRDPQHLLALPGRLPFNDARKRRPRTRIRPESTHALVVSIGDLDMGRET